jgi:hypothetical protein
VWFLGLFICANVDQKQVKIIVPAAGDDDMLFAKHHDKTDLKRLFSMAIDGMSQVFSAQKPLLAVELFVLRMALRPPMSDAITINYCLQKLDAIMHHRPLPKEPLPVQAIAVAKDTRAPEIAKTKNHEETVDQFGALIAHLDKTMPALASHLRHARPIVHENAIALHFEQSLHYEQTGLMRTNKALSDAIEHVFGRKLALTLELKSASPAVKAVKTVWEADEERQKLEEKALYDRAKENPLVKKALEIFGGDVMSVKRAP